MRFKSVGKIYYFDPQGEKYERGDYVIVETVRGVEIGEVILSNRTIAKEDIVAQLKPVIRRASQDDFIKHEENKKKEKEAFAVCLKKIKEHNLDMKLIDVEYTFDGGKILFYFTADGRIDFRELVKSLATVFRTRIELRQIGVRDEAKMVGGSVWWQACCRTFGDFEPVSIKCEGAGCPNPSKIGTCED